MGFYAPAQIVRDAIEHGVEVRPVCINASRWDCTLEPNDDETRFAVRLGMRMVKGLANAHAAAIVAVRADTPYGAVDDLWHRAGVPALALKQLADADAFRPSLGLERREALWHVKGLRDEPLPLFAAASAREAVTVSELDEPAVPVNPMTEGSQVVADYGRTGLSLRRHPVSFQRQDLARRGMVTCHEAMNARDRRWLEAAGIVSCSSRWRMRPASPTWWSGRRSSRSTAASSWARPCSRSGDASSGRGKSCISWRTTSPTCQPSLPASAKRTTRSQLRMAAVTNSTPAAPHPIPAGRQPED
jgi:DNA polymerase III alpha subunit